MYDIKRQVLGISKEATSSGSTSACYVYICASPFKYRISNGKLYQQERNISEDWSPVQKIKLGSCDILNGEIVNLDIRSAQSMQWQTDGNYLSTI